MKKVIHGVAVYAPLILSGIIVLFLLGWLFRWVFIPYNGYVWCGVSAAVTVLVGICVKRDYQGKALPKMQETGLLLFACASSAWWIYIWSTVKYTLILPFALICIVWTLYLAFRLCEDTVKRTLGLMVGFMLAVVTLIIVIVPVLSPMTQVKDRFGVYNDQAEVAKVVVIRDAGNVYNIAVSAKKTGGNLLLGRFENTDEVSIFYKIVDVSDYHKPELVWQGADLYIDGERTEIYWE